MSHDSRGTDLNAVGLETTKPLGLFNEAEHTWSYSTAQWAMLRHRALLTDFPRYQTLFRQYGIEDVPMFVPAEEVRATFGMTFDARLSFHAPGSIGRDLAQFAPEAGATAHTIATMSRFGDGYNSFLVAVSVSSEDSNLVDIGSVLRAYGHFLEQRLLAGKRPYRAGEIRDTSFMAAVHAVERYCPSLNKALVPIAADAAVAWVNGIWLCHLFNIDPRVIIVGAVLDEVSSPELSSRFLESVFPAWREIILEREAATNAFTRSAEIVQGRPGEQLDCFEFCKQADAASRALFSSLL